MRTCKVCHGAEEIDGKPCPHCGGTGFELPDAPAVDRPGRAPGPGADEGTGRDPGPGVPDDFKGWDASDMTGM